MKKHLNHLKAYAITCLLLSSVTSFANQVGFVDITKVFNDSVFIKEENQRLQNEATEMNQQIDKQKQKLRDLIEKYHATKDDAGKKKLETPLKTEELVLKNLTSSFQEKIESEKTATKQQFDSMLKTATSNAAKTKRVNIVINGQSILYHDSSWIDLTSEIEKEMQKLSKK
jgi:outer membrane protein